MIGHLVIANALHIDTGVEVPFCWSDFAFKTSPTDPVIANKSFDVRLVQAYEAARSVFKGGQTSGQSQTQPGFITVENTDRTLYNLTEYTFGGRLVRQWVGEQDTMSLSDLPTVSGYAQQPDVDRLVTLRLVDAKAPFDKNIQSIKYAGTGGKEGTAALRGKPKVILIGGSGTQEIRAPCLDPIKELYDIHNGPVAAVINVKTAGGRLANGGTYATEAEWLNDALQPAFGFYKTWHDGGKVRINTDAIGRTITINAIEATRTTAQACKIVAALVGVTDDGLVLDDFTALDVKQSAQVERWIGPEEVAAKVIFDEFAIGAGCGWGGRQRDAKIRLVRVQERPEGAVVQTFKPTDSPDDKPIRQESSDDKQKGKPAKRVTVLWGHNYSVLAGGDLLDSVSALDRSSFSQADQNATAYDAPTDARFLDALELVIPSRFAYIEDAQAEADRLLEFRKTPRFGFQLTANYTTETAQRDLFDKIGVIDASRGLSVEGMNDGIPMWTLSVAPDAQAHEIEIGCWGSTLTIRNLATQDGFNFATQSESGATYQLVSQGT